MSLAYLASNEEYPQRNHQMYQHEANGRTNVERHPAKLFAQGRCEEWANTKTKAVY